jgi:hypothetical protein
VPSDSLDVFARRLTEDFAEMVPKWKPHLDAAVQNLAAAGSVDMRALARYIVARTEGAIRRKDCGP